MVSPGRLFNTPPGVRMSPGKKRVLWGPAPNLKSVHAALTRASAALAESRNIEARMMEAGVHKRAAHQREQKLVNELANLWTQMRVHPSVNVQQRTIQRIIRVQREMNEVAPNVRNKEKRSERLIRQFENSTKRYHQLARRVAYLNGTRNLNNRPLTQREKEAIRVTAAIVKNMSAARRTVRHLPLPRNMGHLVIRASARR